MVSRAKLTGHSLIRVPCWARSRHYFLRPHTLPCHIAFIYHTHFIDEEVEGLGAVSPAQGHLRGSGAGS